MNQMVNLRLNLKQDELKCENCGAKLSEDEIYVREINGKEHYFCCSHCADKYEARFK
ncbi:eL24 family ribosomal protein [Saccharolobus shibatae]|nr:transcriptional regulator [Saccharolobus shibatae]